MSSSDGNSVILSGWKAAGITNALEKGLTGFAREILDTYIDTDLFDQGDIYFDMALVTTTPSEEFVEKERERVVKENSDDEYLIEENEGE